MSMFFKSQVPTVPKRLLNRRSRSLFFEPLEERALLAVAAADFDAIRAAYPDLNLSANMSDYNIIEITAEQLSEANLSNAIEVAGQTTSNDLIVVRTTATQNKILLSETEEPYVMGYNVSIDATTYGSVTIVSLGDEKLTLDGSNIFGTNIFLLGGSYNPYRTQVGLAGLVITGGNSGNSGGGIWTFNCDLIVTQVTIDGNTAGAGGGCRFSEGSTVIMTDSIVQNNSGGGIFLDNADVTMTNVTIANNSTESHGAGIYVSQSDLSITNSIFTDNKAQHDGGGIYIIDSQIAIFNSYMRYNRSNNGAAIALYGSDSRLECVNTLIVSNNAWLSGAGIYQDQGILHLTNVTIANNNAYGANGQGGGIARKNGSMEIFNSIIADNFASRSNGYEYTPNYAGISGGSGFSIVYLENSLIGYSEELSVFHESNGCLIGSGDEWVNPMFVDARKQDFRLQYGSPAIDSGNGIRVKTASDVNGEKRINGNTVDMGAYEWQGVVSEFNTWIGPDDGDWFDAENWGYKKVPTADDKVFIPESTMVTIASNAYTTDIAAKSILCDGTINFSDRATAISLRTYRFHACNIEISGAMNLDKGHVEVEFYDSNVNITGSLYGEPGTDILVTNGIFLVTGDIQVDSVSFRCENGEIRLPTLASYRAIYSSRFHVNSGLIDLPALTTITGEDGFNSVTFYIVSNEGQPKAEIKFPALESIPENVHFYCINSTLDLTNLINNNFMRKVSFYFDGEDAEILGLDRIKSLEDARIYCYNGNFNFANITSFRNVSLLANNSHVTFPELTDYRNSDDSFQRIEASRATIEFPALTSLVVTAGNTLEKSYTHFVSTSALISFPLLTTLGVSEDGYVLFNAANGGNILATSLSTLSHTGTIEFVAEKTGSMIDVSSLRQIQYDNIRVDERAGGVVKFHINYIPKELVVSTLNDENDGDFTSGQLSLREAVYLASLHGDKQTISFDPSLFFEGQKTIKIEALSPIEIYDQKLDIIGPGKNLLTLDGDFGCVFSIVNSEVALDGVTFTHSDKTRTDRGSALSIQNSEIIVTDTIFDGCFNDGIYSSAIFADASEKHTLTLKNVDFVNNTGAAIYSRSANESTLQTIIVENCFFDGNSSHYRSAAIAMYGGILDVVDSVFSNNTTGTLDSAQVVNGGAIELSRVSANFDRVAFVNNKSLNSNDKMIPTSAVKGGALLLYYGNITISNSLFADNETSGRGGALYLEQSNVSIYNSTVVDNKAALAQSGGVCLAGKNSVSLYNSIFYGNIHELLSTENGNPCEIDFYPPLDTTISVKNNLFGVKNWTGQGDENSFVDIDPLFLDSANGDYRLAKNSPMIDQGMNSNVITEKDLDGNSRILGGAVDIGAYEFVAIPSVVLETSGMNVSPMVIAGTMIDIAWALSNLGNIPHKIGVVENFYLSPTQSVDDGVLLKTNVFNETIAALDHVPRSETLLIPVQKNGDYRVIVETIYDGKSLFLVSDIVSIISPELTLTSNVSTIKEDNSSGVTMTLMRTGSLANDLVVQITSSDTTELTVPQTVTIPVGETSVIFLAMPVQDNVKDGNQTAIVTVSAEFYSSQSLKIIVQDVSPAELKIDSLSVSLKQLIAGTQMNVAWFLRNLGELTHLDGYTESIYITDTGSKTGAVLLETNGITTPVNGLTTIPRTKTLTVPLSLAGEYQIIVELIAGGKSQVLLSDPITILPPALTLTSNVSTIKEDNSSGVIMTLTRTGSLTNDLVVQITSSDTTELTVPQTVMIPAGETSVTFLAMPVQDNVKDSNQTVIVTVSAEFYSSQSLEIIVQDVSPVELVNHDFSVPEEAKPGSTLLISWWCDNVGDLPSNGWVDNIYISSDGQMENATRVATFSVNAWLQSEGSFYRLENVKLPQTWTGSCYIILETVYDGKKSEPVVAEIRMIREGYLAKLTMPETENGCWTVRRNVDKIEIIDSQNTKVFEDDIDVLKGLNITTPTLNDADIVVDFSHGNWVFENTMGLIGHPDRNNSLSLIGSDGTETFQFDNSEIRFNDLRVKSEYFENIFVDGLGGSDKATIIGPETNGIYSMGDNSFVMQAGGYRVDLRGFNRIDAFADGHRDKTYVYGQNNSLIFMNDQYVERRGEGQAYRIWRSEKIIAINMDNTNNAIIHNGSRSFDSYTISENYSSVTNANGSYFHEWFDFKTVNISSRNASVSLPGKTDGTTWTPLDDRKIWQRNDTSVTIFGSANVSFRGVPFETSQSLSLELPPDETVTQSLSPLQTMIEAPVATTQNDMTTAPVWSYVSTQTATDQPIVPNMDLVSPMQLFDVNTQTVTPVTVIANVDATQANMVTLSNAALLSEGELLYVWLAEEQYQASKKKLSEIFDDTDNWLEDFEEITLRELRK